MRKRTWLVVLFLVGVLVITIGATSVFAQEPTVPDGETWEEMHQACVNGDYETMAKWHAQYHGGEGTATGGMMGNGGMGGSTMGNGMMGGGMMNGGTMGGW